MKDLTKQPILCEICGQQTGLLEGLDECDPVCSQECSDEHKKQFLFLEKKRLKLIGGPISVVWDYHNNEPTNVFGMTKDQMRLSDIAKKDY
jgi:hypothetical protein